MAAPPSGPPPSYRPPIDEYAPPPGPPPGHPANQEQYTPPSGPPLGYSTAQERYDPPPAPPPSQSAAHEHYAPPPGPPPTHTDAEPPPYHDWTVIPDTALLPPPPSIGHHASPSSNASLSEADRAHAWCRAFPMIRPHEPTQQQHAAILNGDVRLMKAPEYKGDLLMPERGFWRGTTRSGAKDACLLTSAPLYFAAADSPMRISIKKTIYFEVRVRSLGSGHASDESSIAIGFCAMPYPTWRMPGWERGSLAVHSDDGRRYVNDTWGGKDFTSPFKAGDTIGLGITYSVPEKPPEYGLSEHPGSTLKGEVFLTRNGRKGESWDLHEELDVDNEFGIDGLDGQFDLHGAVGVFGGVEFDVTFHRQHWTWLPR